MLLVLLALCAGSALGDTRIFNGLQAVYGQFPYQAMVTEGGRYACSGVVVTLQHVLTFGPCATNASALQVVVGAQFVASNGEPGRVSRPVTDAAFSPNGLLALLTLKTHLVESRYVQAVRLPSRVDVLNQFAGLEATVAGWGETSPGSGPSSGLRYAAVRVLDTAQCGAPVGIDFLCTLSPTGAKECVGDEGSALTVTVAGAPLLIGVMEGTDCSLEHPTIYQRVTSYLDWIGDQTGLLID